MGTTKRIAVLVAIALLSACSGGGGSAPAPTANTPNNPTQQGPQSQVRLTFSIPAPARTSSSTKRSPKFVAPTTQGAIVSLWTQSTGCPGACTGSYNTVALTNQINLSSGSGNCVNNADGSRTCSIYLPAAGTQAYCNPPSNTNGCDQFELDTYDQTPPYVSEAGCNPGVTCTYNELATAETGFLAVASGSTVSVVLSLEGIVDGFGLPFTPTEYPNGTSVASANSQLNNTPLYVGSALGNGVQQTGTIAASGVTIDDSDGNPITSLTATSCGVNDQYANRIGITETEDLSGAFDTAPVTTGLTIGPASYAIAVCPGTGPFVQPQNDGGQGSYLAFPNDMVEGIYSGGPAAGGAGNETSTPPYYFWLHGAPIPWNGWPGQPTPVTGFAVTAPGQGNGLVAPLFALVQNPASSGAPATVDSSNSGTATLRFNGPGTGTGTIWAAQFLLPSLSTGYSMTPNAACGPFTDANNISQNVVTTQGPTAATWGASWVVTPGNVSSPNPNGSCVLTLSDGVNNVTVSVVNTVAGGGTIVIP
jgi:hypothetical protein